MGVNAKITGKIGLLVMVLKMVSLEFAFWSGSQN